MKKLFLAAASTAFISTGAFAQVSATDSFVVNASVTQTCVMENVNDITIGTPLALITTAGADALEFGNGSTGETSNQVYLSCNDTNTMTITTSGPLVNSRGVTGDEAAEGFSDEIDFRVYANNYVSGTGNNRLNYRTVNGQTYNGGSRRALHRLISFTGSVDYDDNREIRPIAGNYTATAFVTIAPGA